MERGSFNSWGGTDGDNPLYKTFPSEPSEYYDEIKEGCPKPPTHEPRYNTVPCHDATPTSLKTTLNVLYDSGGTTLVHPTLDRNPSTLDRNPSTLDRNPSTSPEPKKQQGSCKCTVDMCIFVTSLFVILISLSAIIIALLLWFAIISVVGTAQATPTLSNSKRQTSLPSCDCQVADIDLGDLRALRNELSEISSELDSLEEDEVMNQALKSNQLADLVLRVKTVNDSIQQIKVLASQPKTPITRGLAYEANVGISLQEGCVTSVAFACRLERAFPNGGLFISTCEGGTEAVVTNGQIIVKYTCHVNHTSSTGVDAAALVDRLDGNKSYMDNNLRCACINKEEVPYDCIYYMTRCPLIGTVPITHTGFNPPLYV